MWSKLQHVPLMRAFRSPVLTFSRRPTGVVVSTLVPKAAAPPHASLLASLGVCATVCTFALAPGGSQVAAADAATAGALSGNDIDELVSTTPLPPHGRLGACVWGAWTAQGPRPYQEDRLQVAGVRFAPGNQQQGNEQEEGADGALVFMMLDGHGGAEASEFVRTRLADAWATGVESGLRSPSPAPDGPLKSLPAAMAPRMCTRLDAGYKLAFPRKCIGNSLELRTFDRSLQIAHHHVRLRVNAAGPPRANN